MGFPSSKRVTTTFALVLALLFTSCGESHGEAQKSRVIFIGIDGLGSHNLWPTDASIDAPSTPALNSIMNDASYSKSAVIDERNWSGPNWASMLTGENSDTHGVLENNCVQSSVPTVFDRLAEKAPQLDIGLVGNWEMLACYSKPGSADFSTIVTGDNTDVGNAALTILKEREPNFLFVYFGSVDDAGHAHGARSDEYRVAIENADAAIGTLVDYLKQHNLYDDTQIIVSSDHGHDVHANGHSDAQHPVPLFVKSNSMRQGEIKSTVRNSVVAPTILRMMGL